MDIEALSPAARAERYRTLAREQMEMAARASEPEVRAVCLELAGMWTRLAAAADASRAGAQAEVDDPDTQPSA